MLFKGLMVLSTSGNRRGSNGGGVIRVNGIVYLG